MYSNPTGFGQQQQQQQPQYGAAYGQQQPPMMGQQQQQPQPFAPQPTGFGQPAPLQNQYTGFPMAGQQQQQPQPLMGQATGLQPQQSAFQPQQTGFQPQQTGFQPQNTGFQPQQQQFQQSAMPPMPSIPAQYQQQYQQQQPQQPQQSQFQQPPQQQQQPAPSLQLPQATGFPSVTPPQQTSSAPSLIPPPPAPPQKAQATGFAQMAASFQTSKPQTPAAPSKPNSVPNIRLSFITASDQARFENLFAKSVGDGNTTMTGEKARDLLLRSRLDGDSLSQIWTLADTTRSGQLHFPEFALAMYLCNLKLTGKALPPVLPDTIKNEVSSMVDIINFSIAEQVAASGRATPLAAPQPQPSNSQLLQTQMTGFPGTQQIPQIQQSQPTGFQPQPTGFQAQPTGFQSQQTGIQTQATGYNTQGAGYNGPRPPMPPMPSSFSSGLAPMAAPLNAQPTGRPGQWGLVNTPATGLPNIDALAARMMPQNDRASGSFTTSGLQGNAVIPWAITKDEKIRYDSLFNTWDGLNKGFIGGSQAREIFEQSGLEKPDLERIWTLADSANKGRLDMDEFAIAMHLIYRKLNGYPVPSTLPPELVPPSTRNLTKSIGAMKNMLHEESEHRKNSGAALLPQKTGVSYAKNHSFKSGSRVGSIGGRKDATVFKNNDDDVGYRSSARRRANNRSPQPGTTPSNDEELSLDQLRKKVREKQVLLDAMDFKDEKNSEEDDILDRRDRRDADDLYRRIRRIQEDIDSHPDAALSSGDSDAERRALKRQLQKLTDKIPELASAVRRTEKEISEARLELFRIRDAKQYPGSATSIIGTGPGGAITESDRLKARAKAMMQQRTAALTGRKIEGASDDLDAPKRLEEESMKIRYEKENNERMVQDVEDSVREFSRSIEDNLKSEMKDSSSEHERRRWEDALGVEDEVRDFIFDLQRDSRSARLRAQEKRGLRAEPPSRTDSPASRLSNSSPAGLAKTSSPAPSAGGSYSSYEAPEQRAAFIKQQAEQRMAERLAALGIKAPTKPGESAAQRIERERAEREAKLRQAEEEDSRREAQRQARLAEEQGVPVPVEPVEEPKQEPKKAPPPPATRKAPVAKPEPTSAAAPQDDYDNEREAAESRLRALEEQVRQNKLRKEEEKKKKKAALAEAKERESKAAARRAEIEAVRKREEELQRQLASMDDDSDSSDDSEGPGYTGSQGLDAPPPAPAPAPVSVSPPPSSSPSVPSAAAAATSETESKNPFFRMMSQSSSSTPTTAPAVPAPAPPAAPAAATSAADASTNPFFRPPPVSSTPVPAAPAAPVMPTLSISRDNQDDSDDDGWGSNNDNSDDESDDGRPGGNSAAHLASLLFSTMAPPRPMSAADEKPTSSSPVSSSPFPPPTASSAPPAPIAAPPVEAPEIAETPEVPVPISVPSGDAPPPPPPPPPPPMPTDAPAAPPPPPPPPPPPSAPGSAPPPPGGGPPPPPPPPAPAPAPGGGSILSSGGPPAGLLGQIQLGKTLRKTNTQDKSAAVGAGRVL